VGVGEKTFAVSMGHTSSSETNEVKIWSLAHISDLENLNETKKVWTVVSSLKFKNSQNKVTQIIPDVRCRISDGFTVKSKGQ
jgi:hypothetical protein